MNTTWKMFLSAPNTGLVVVHLSVLVMQICNVCSFTRITSSTLMPPVPGFHTAPNLLQNLLISVVLIVIVLPHTTTNTSMFNFAHRSDTCLLCLLAYQMSHSRLTYVIMSQGPLEFRTQDYLQNICNPPVPPKNGHLLLHIIVGLLSCNTSKMRRHHSIPRKHHKMYSRTPHYVQTFDDICKMCFQ